MVGDPSGKTQERPLLPEETLRANVEAIRTQLAKFLDFSPGRSSALLLNNYDWMSRFGYLEFLREVGKHFPVNVMLAKDSVRLRLEPERCRSQLHRIQLHVASGLRLCLPLSALWLRTSNWRQRSVGEHHRRY